MQEQLVGYLLGALESAEVRSVELLLEQDAEARRQLEILRDALLPLASGGGFVDPPPGLVAKTFAPVRRTHEPEGESDEGAPEHR